MRDATLVILAVTEMLTKKAINDIEGYGLVIFGKNRHIVSICKPLTVVGNCIEGRVRTPICELEMINGELKPKDDPFETDAPVLRVFTKKKKYSVEVWQWVPGPGPGDFHLNVSSEREAIEFVKNYFFGENEYFLAFEKYCMENPNR